jgi:accessory gene regulator protein AgrB
MKVNFPIAKDDEPGWLGKLATGKLGVAKTYLHFLLAMIFISAVTFFAVYADWNFWAIVLAVVIYAIYIFNVGKGLWYASKIINNKALRILTKCVSIFSYVCGISAFIRAANLVLLYLQLQP